MRRKKNRTGKIIFIIVLVRMRVNVLRKKGCEESEDEWISEVESD